MVVRSVNSNTEKINKTMVIGTPQQKHVAFRGINPVVGLMDVIEKGGYATSFIIQDGFGFVLPRVGKGILRGGEKKDENGNVILDKNGKPKREYNWAYARKEGIREIITGPSAFLIPLGLLTGIKKFFGRAHNVKLDYIDSFRKPFTEFAKNNFEALQSGNVSKNAFYEEVFADAIRKSINDNLPEAEHMTEEEIRKTAKAFTTRQIQVENVKANKSLSKKERKAKLNGIGSVEDEFMRLKKNKIGGSVNELAVQISASDGSVKHGSISQLLGAMDDYFSDAVTTTQKAVKNSLKKENIEAYIKNFTNRRMGSRVLTNFALFGAVAAFFTQIPKLYNMGLKNNPALKGTAAENAVPAEQKPATNEQTTVENAKDVPFTGAARVLEKAGEKVFNGKHLKSLSDLFELSGPVIPGTAMTFLLYGFCIPPRLRNAQDKYDYAEIGVRDLTSFTALLFGAKALSRLFSDGFTKLTGLALNKKQLEGRNIFQKIIDYLNPNDGRHSVLNSKQLNSKYSKLEEYKGGVNGFVDFIETSGGNIKKAFAQDKQIKAAVDDIVRKYTKKSFKDATIDEIKSALKTANEEKSTLIKKFYELFDENNKLLNRAKTYNSTFGFLSTILLVPALIVWLTNVCKKMTDKRTAQDFAAKNQSVEQQPSAEKIQQLAYNSNKISMSGFLNNAN